MRAIASLASRFAFPVPIAACAVVALCAAAPAPAHGGAISPIAAAIPVQGNPRAVAADPVTDKIYVTNLGSDSVSVINGRTNTVTRSAAAQTE
jgi:YVTN family beta-propeller protein